MTTLIVTLPLELSGAATPYEHVLVTSGGALGAHATAPANLLPLPSGATGELVAVVPVQALSWHSVALPKGTLQKKLLSGAGNSPRLQAVLEGLLEDRLLDETTELHLALAPDAHDGAPVWVAACNRAWLRAALQPLEEAKRSVTRIVPEFAPDQALRVHVIGTPEHAQLVAAGEHGVVVLPLSPASLAVALAGSQVDEEAVVLAEPAVAAQAEQVLQRRVELQQSTQRALQASQSRWDLAQFGFVNSSRSRAWKRLATQIQDVWQAPRWRAARWGAGVLVAAHLVGLNAWAWKETSALQGKRDAIRQTLTATFPNVKVVVDAPVQMERELALLRQSSGAASSRDFEAMLAGMGGASARAAAAAPAPSALEYSAGELRLKGFSLPDAQAAAVAAQLRSVGYNARNEGDRLVMKPETTP